jgi:murein DD-endopeptidase MepM/ murein hydrolase activator NlpD
MLNLLAGFEIKSVVVPDPKTGRKGQIDASVTSGQLIGRLGNSGNSDAPHLHFHLGDANAPLGSEGIPWVFERFERLRIVPSLMAALGPGWKATEAPSSRTRELPLENEVVKFP